MCNLKIWNYFAFVFWSLQTRGAVYTFTVSIPVGAAHHKGSSGWSRPWRLWEPAGVLQSPRAREREWERQTRDQQAPGLNLVLSKTWGCHQNPECQPSPFPSPFPGCTPTSSLSPHTHRVWNLQLKFPQRSLSWKNLQQKGQKSSCSGEQYEGSLKTENRVPIWPCNPSSWAYIWSKR